MIYNLRKKCNYIRLLGHVFIKNNRNKGKFIINNKKYSLREFLYIENYNSNKIKIGLILYNHISNKSSMFEECKSLIEFSSHNKTDIDLKENDFLNLKEEKFDKQIKINDLNETINRTSNFQSFYRQMSEILSLSEEDNSSSSIIASINDNIMFYEYDYSIIYDKMFYNCINLLHLYDEFQKNYNNI